MGRHSIIARSAVNPGIAPITIPQSSPIIIAIKLENDAKIEKPIAKFSSISFLLLWQLYHEYLLEYKIGDNQISTDYPVKPPFPYAEVKKNSV
jgi:hypothetical protein